MYYYLYVIVNDEEQHQINMTERETRLALLFISNNTHHYFLSELKYEILLLALLLL
jgi:hypothetical protein